ncbi:lipopolysaccharide assembly protein LapA domain-containing protein [Lichenicoccus roseus]|uniref:LapA family protein n=1 Tax=Lichenicoccus roseus TaxID=2683649 RepID=A0A5R9J181_9PROT|nr:LapA family protein [Lichenicoccus roseus]TLU71384.1 LapA family protein [Lichenicoccus roseus]
MLRLIVTLPFLIVLVVFAFVNQQVVTLDLPYIFSGQSSLAMVVIVVALVFFLIGGLAVWFAELRQRRRARRAESTIRSLETQVVDLRQQLANSNAQLAAQASLAPHGQPGSTTYLPVTQPPSAF